MGSLASESASMSLGFARWASLSGCPALSAIVGPEELLLAGEGATGNNIYVYIYIYIYITKNEETKHNKKKQTCFVVRECL